MVTEISQYCHIGRYCSGYSIGHSEKTGLLFGPAIQIMWLILVKLRKQIGSRVAD